MDEAAVREHAEAHAHAVQSGDLGRAASDLTDEAKQQAPTVMKALPRPITASAVESVTAEDDAYVARILYQGDESKATVSSRWVEQSGRPMIAAMEIV